MVDIFDFSMFSGIMGTLSGTVKVVLALGIIGALAWWVYQKRQYKYDVNLKVLKHGSFMTYRDVAKIVKEQGVSYWKLKKLKEIASVPPPDSTTQGMGGRFVAEGYYERSRGILWSRDLMTRQEFEQKADELRTRGIGSKDKDNIIDTTYQPLSTQERALQAQQVTKAITRKGKNWIEMLVQFAPAIIMIIFVIIIVLFWDRITQPTLTAQSNNVAYMEQLRGFQEQNLRLYMMLTGGKGNGTYIVQELPNDEQIFLRPKTEVPKS